MNRWRICGKIEIYFFIPSKEKVCNRFSKIACYISKVLKIRWRPNQRIQGNQFYCWLKKGKTEWHQRPLRVGPIIILFESHQGILQYDNTTILQHADECLYSLRFHYYNTTIRQYYNTPTQSLRSFINGASVPPILQYDNTTILQYANINTIITLYYLSPF